jgi:hypothetical protein
LHKDLVKSPVTTYISYINHWGVPQQRVFKWSRCIEDDY